MISLMRANITTSVRNSYIAYVYYTRGCSSWPYLLWVLFMVERWLQNAGWKHCQTSATAKKSTLRLSIIYVLFLTTVKTLYLLKIKTIFMRH